MKGKSIYINTLKLTVLFILGIILLVGTTLVLKLACIQTKAQETSLTRQQNKNTIVIQVKSKAKSSAPAIVLFCPIKLFLIKL